MYVTSLLTILTSILMLVSDAFHLKACSRNDKKVEKLSSCMFSLFGKLQRQTEMEQGMAVTFYV